MAGLNPAHEQLRAALRPIAPGRWVVGVSGGADSVALLCALVRLRPDLSLFVAHLNHESRGVENDADGAFVSALASRLSLPLLLLRQSEVPVANHRNLEARYRAARLALFTQAIAAHGAAGVLLAQHRDDRAETVLMRLLRGGEPWALDGLRPSSLVNGIHLQRPLLSLGRETLRDFLVSISQTWRDDASNSTDLFARNRARRFLQHRRDLVPTLLRLADTASAWRAWVEESAPTLGHPVPVGDVADLPDPIARHALRQWLTARGVAREDVAPSLVQAMIDMTRDRSTPPTINLPGGHIARRRRGMITFGPASSSHASHPTSPETPSTRPADSSPAP